LEIGDTAGLATCATKGRLARRIALRQSNVIPTGVENGAGGWPTRPLLTSGVLSFEA
jgi:hypothetical protein